MPSRKDYWYCTSYFGNLAHKVGIITLCHSTDPNVEIIQDSTQCPVAMEEKCLGMDLAIYYCKHFWLSRVF